MEESFSITQADTYGQEKITQKQASSRGARLCLDYVSNNGKCDIRYGSGMNDIIFHS